MDYSFDTDFGTIVLTAAAVGAFGGLIWDVANPIRRFSKEPATGLDNRLTLPRFKTGQGSGLDLGFLGPMLMGAATGILLVLLGGRGGPNGQDVVAQLANLAAATGQDPSTTAAAAKTAEKALATGISKQSLYILAFVGGIAGWALLQSLSTRLTSLFEVVVKKSAETASEAAASAVRQAAARQGLALEESDPLVTAARDAVVASASLTPAS